MQLHTKFVGILLGVEVYGDPDADCIAYEILASRHEGKNPRRITFDGKYVIEMELDDGPR